MADPYSGVSITGYNSNPPVDDGSQTEANRVKWSTIKTKITDPVKTRTDDMDTALIAAFARMIGGAGITSTAISYTVVSGDQGKLVRATASGITITSPDATDVDAPFVFCLLNDSTGDITFDGSGSQTVDGDANVTLPAGTGLTVFTDGTNWFTAGQNFQRTLIQPQGYLSLAAFGSIATSPLVPSNYTTTAVYYRIDRGNLVPIPDGTTFSVREFTELTLTLNDPNHVANAIYDVFAFSDSGTIRIGTGPAWTTATAGSGARGTGAGSTELAVLKGLFVNNVSMTARNGSSTYSVAAKSGLYLGSIHIDSSAGQVSCFPEFGQSRKWGVWNAYNRRRIFMQAGDSTASWNYTTNTARPSNNSAANSLTVLTGLPDETCNIQFAQWVTAGSTVAQAQVIANWKIGIGKNSTTTMTGKSGRGGIRIDGASVDNLLISDATASYLNSPTIGINTFTALEQTTSTSGNPSVTYTGTADGMLLSAAYMG